MGKPKIRFEGYTDDWEQSKLIDVCDYVDYRGKTPTKTDSGVFLVTAKNVKDGYIDYEASQEYISEDDYEEVMHRGKPEIGDVLITTEAPCGNVAQVNRVDIALAQRIIKYRGHSNAVDNTYLKYYLLSAEFQNILNAKSSGGTVKGIKGSILHQQEMKYPKYEEQVKIGQQLNALDTLITLHQRKCEETKTLKKYMLQKMFPKNGQTIPEIRFSGFTDDWEQRKLLDVVEKLTGGTSIAPDDYTEDGYRTIPKGAVNETGVANLSGCKYVSNSFFEKNISSKTSSGELVTSLRDLVPTAPNMGRIVRIIGASEYFLMPQGVYSIKVKEKIDEDYLIAYSNSPRYRKIISAEKNGSTQVHIRNGEFLNIDLPMPCYEEQRLIGKIISNLDHLITLHQRKCEELQNIKKFMLQNMFV